MLLPNAIEPEELQQHRVAACRRMAATLLEAMAYRKVGYLQIGNRIGETPEQVRSWIIALADGQDGDALRRASYIATALDCRLAIRMTDEGLPIPVPFTDEESEAAA
jgi:hypothetical protein